MPRVLACALLAVSTLGASSALAADDEEISAERGPCPDTDNGHRTIDGTCRCDEGFHWNKKAHRCEQPCVRRIGRAVTPGVNYCEDALTAKDAIPQREPTTHEICLANQSRYPDLVKDGKPLTAYQVCLWSWHSRDPALIWCLNRWDEDHQLKRFGTMEECIAEAREHQQAEEALARDEAADERAQQQAEYDQYVQYQQARQEEQRHREGEDMRRALRAIGDGLNRPPPPTAAPQQVNCTTMRYGNIAQTTCQ
jgi:hypothetical protein